ncbi:hypothetical protein GCM10028818_33200 [Spirosoma horti]
MDLLQAFTELPNLVADYKKVAAELAATQRELAALKEDKYVNWEWICEYFGVTKKTGYMMLANEKVFVHGRKIKRFKKSDILRFAERNSIKLKEIAT